jgi:hypothetical protein
MNITVKQSRPAPLYALRHARDFDLWLVRWSANHMLFRHDRPRPQTAGAITRSLRLMSKEHRALVRVVPLELSQTGPGKHVQDWLLERP